ncbi:hypothetical protein AHS81_20460 [Salmonella enterica]|nr:hypothetical protein [Salmonella enterica]
MHIWFLLLHSLRCCQANYIHDIRGGNVAPSSSTSLMGVSISQKLDCADAPVPLGTEEADLPDVRVG